MSSTERGEEIDSLVMGTAAKIHSVQDFTAINFTGRVVGATLGSDGRNCSLSWQ